MSEEPLENIGAEDPNDDEFDPTQEAADSKPTRRKRIKKLFAVSAVVLFAGLLTGLILVATGAVDSYIRAQFTAKMQRMGMSFKAEKFSVRINPLHVRIVKAEFTDRETGAKLISIKEANVDLTVRDLWALRFSRDVSIDATDIEGAEIFVNFDENGRSNFANVKMVEDKEAIKVSFRSSRLSVRESAIVFGDTRRNLSAETDRLTVSVEPIDTSVPDDKKRYAFDLAAEDAYLGYDQKKLEDIDVRAKGVVDATGADVDELSVNSPAGDTRIAGRIEGWDEPEFNLKVDSAIDLTMTTDVFPLGTPIKGIGNFSGKVSGRGENFKVDGKLSSESLSASQISLKGLDVSAALEGRDGAYEANGKAIAKMLTVGDFQMDLLQMSGLIRGTGTDFKWLGELQAAAAKTRSGTIGGLFISDAVAEYNEKRYASSFGRTRAKSYSLSDLLISDIDVGGLRITSEGEVTEITTPGAQAADLKTDDLRLRGISSGRIEITDRGDITDIKTPKLYSKSARLGDFDFADLSSNNVSIRSRNGTTDITADNLASQAVRSGETAFGKVEAKGLTIKDSDAGLTAYAEGMSVARIDSDAVVVGSLNIAGVRLSIVRGTVEFKSEDFSADEARIPPNSVFANGGRLEGVKVSKPVFVLENSGRYRATADMSLGGGAIGTIKLGSAKASVTVTKDEASLHDLSASVIDGDVTGNASFALTESGRSTINVGFADVDLAKLLAIQGGSLLPLSGKATGTADLSFEGAVGRKASGKIEADIEGTSSDADGLIDVSGRIEAEGTNGLFDIGTAQLRTAATSLNATGKVDLATERSALDFKLDSSDAKEVERVLRSFDLSPEIRKRIEEYRIEFAGMLGLVGKVAGNISDPILEAKLSLQSLGIRGVMLGALRTDLLQSPDMFRLENGMLTEDDGGTLSFDFSSPEYGVNNTAFNATLFNVNAGNLIAALPFDVPNALRELKADTSGEIRLAGLPEQMQGEMNLVANKASIADESFDRIEANAKFEGTLIDFKKLRVVIGDGQADALGSYRTDSTDFAFSIKAVKVPIPKLQTLIPNSASLPEFDGVVDLTGEASGKRTDSSTFAVGFNGTGKGFAVNSSLVGNIFFNGTTKDRMLYATVRNGDVNNGETLNARVDFADPKLRFTVDGTLNNAALDPYIAAVRPAGNVRLSGKAAGTVGLEGNFFAPDSRGEMVFSANGLKGRANFSRFEIQIDQTQLVATEPVELSLTDDALNFDRATFAGGGSNLKITGTRAFTDNVENNLAVVGRVNLALLNLVVSDTFFSGAADVNVRLNGPNATARLNGRADMVSASVSTFVSAERVALERITGAVIFTSNQAQIEKATGSMGGGEVTISGGAVIGEGLLIDSMKFDLRGERVTVPLPKNFTTTGDVTATVSARRINGELQTFISGRINATRSTYSTNIELADVLGQRKDSPLSSTRGTSGFTNIGFDVIIEGRDALIVRNNLADLTASLSLRVTGDVNAPQVAGRVTANSGTIFFRNERYEVERLELVFPPNTSFEPVINLQASAEIKGYQVVASLSGSLSDVDTLTANVRSNPALPQADVVSLITTGSLANTESGLSTATQSGISAAADILTDEIISKPISKATDKLFGINRFEIDPIISGQRLNPTARLTVGRQINKNLLVTYSTNLAQDQNRVVALEYRLSNRLSVVAQYEQRSLANVTQRANAFSFEIRLRKRF